ncbi:MAG: cytochrome ubiquinol oxidase subunit I, partial [Nitrospiraceae bacterium]|nr:cytochrome ubiquinol oxidase subunit I [Nitrospiraceae bacterium]
LMLWFLFIILSVIAFVLSGRAGLEKRRLFLRIMLYALPLPYIAAQLGWIVAEVGRQPWIVYGVLKTSDAVSKAVSAAQVWTSLAGFTLLYGALAAADIYLLAKTARKGPEPELPAAAGHNKSGKEA